MIHWTLGYHMPLHMIPCTIRLGVTVYSSMLPYAGLLRLARISMYMVLQFTDIL